MFVKVNQSLEDGGETLQNVNQILNTNDPDLPADLEANLTQCIQDFDVLFNRTLLYAEMIEQLTNDRNSTALCPVVEIEELCAELDKKNEELEVLQGTIAALPSGSGTGTATNVIIVNIIVVVYGNCVFVQGRWVYIYVEVVIVIFLELDDTTTTTTTPTTTTTTTIPTTTTTTTRTITILPHVTTTTTTTTTTTFL